MSKPTAIFDFDHTIADTSKPSPNGVTVSSACEMAVSERYGPDGLALYRKQGGLNNDSPTTIVLRLRPGLTGDALLAETEAFVEAKLRRLLPEIGLRMPDKRIWPPLCPGLRNLWNVLSGSPTRTGIVSSGHTGFIGKTFAVHDLATPNVIVTDDDMRRIAIPPQERSKPHPRIFLLAAEYLYPTDLSRTIYFGDDPAKDGGLARNAGVAFGHFDASCSGYEKTGSNFQFSDWQQLLPVLRDWAGY